MANKNILTMEPQDDDAVVPDQAAQAAQDKAPVLFTCETDKKDLLWMGGVTECLSSVLSLFGRTDPKARITDEEWEVNFDDITDKQYLGAGAQGIVFSGNLRGEIVAIKTMKDKVETNLKHLRNLNHENIVRFRGICTEPPTYGVIMEYCQYGSLFNYLHSGALFAPKQILKWAKDIAIGMTYLHDNKIIHRDLKSANILIADNLVVKVSDFGTSREWHDVSTVMSFTGTVAWMAPEIIRHEPCSEKVDVWSYGVLLWELLTQEVPFKNLESQAIMWGVGIDTIALPIPTSCPDSVQLLLNQCLNRVSRNRPPFKIIVAQLETAGRDLLCMSTDCFNAAQACWRKEVQAALDKIYVSSEEPMAPTEQRREQLKQAQDVRQVYEQQLYQANEMFMEACTVRLQLELRERAVDEREKALKACRCGFRKYYEREASSSSWDGVKAADLLPAANERSQCQNQKKEQGNPAKVVVRFVEHETNAPVTITLKKVDESQDTDMSCDCSDDNSDNNNIATNEHGAIKKIPTVKDTVVEQNGNVDIVRPSNSAVLDNHVHDMAQV